MSNKKYGSEESLLNVWNNRNIIWKLSKNDFKKRYAGSYLGKVWAFVQPIVTVVMYWIVFDRILKTKAQLVASGVDVPYVLYLTAGLVPWFYFSEALTGGTNSLLEYNYLVKKVVFNINILPIIKIISAGFTHVFFAGILIFIALLYGYPPSLYMIQIVYYTFCATILTLGAIYATSAVVIFFKDLQQIINIGLQLGMWATPILWDIGMLGGTAGTLIKLNPLCYIVCGYRDSVYGHKWFWQDGWYTLYFWVFTSVLFFVGNRIFNKLKVHFADVM